MTDDIQRALEAHRAARARANCGAGPWDEARLTIAVEMYLRGSSASAIAQHLGPDFSRNSVCGKLHRCGVVKPERATVDMRALGERLRRKERRMRAKTPPAPKTPAHAPENGPSVGIMELAPRSCRWVVAGDGADARFCGGRKAEHSSYCSRHSALAWQERKAGHGRLFRLERLG